MKDRFSCLHPLSLAFTLGILWGLYVFLLGILAWSTGYGVEFIRMLGGIYIGYAASFGGALTGAVWGFVKGFIAGLLISWLYNLFACKCCHKCHKVEEQHEIK